MLRLLEHRLFTPLLRKTDKSINKAKTSVKQPVVIESLFSPKLSTSSSFPNNANTSIHVVNSNSNNTHLATRKSNSNYNVKKHDKRKSSEGNAVPTGGHKTNLLVDSGSKKIKVYTEMATIPSIRSSIVNLSNENETEVNLSPKKMQTLTSPVWNNLLTNEDATFKKSVSSYGGYNNINYNGSFNFQKSRYSSGSLIGVNQRNLSTSSTVSSSVNQNKTESIETGENEPSIKSIQTKSTFLDFGKKILKRVNSGNRSAYLTQRNKRKILSVDKKLRLDQTLATSADSVYVKDDIKNFAKELINLPTFTMPNEKQAEGKVTVQKSFKAIDELWKNKNSKNIKKSNPKIIIDSSFEDELDLDRCGDKVRLFEPKLEHYSHSLNCLCDKKKYKEDSNSKALHSNNNKKHSRLGKIRNSLSSYSQENTINGYLKKFKNFGIRSKSVANIGNSQNNSRAKSRMSCERTDSHKRSENNNSNNSTIFSNHQARAIRPKMLTLNDFDRNKLNIANAKLDTASSRNSDSTTNSINNSFTFLPTPRIGTPNLSIQFQFDENSNNNQVNAKRNVHFSPTEVSERKEEGEEIDEENEEEGGEEDNQQNDKNENQVINTFNEMKHKPGSEVLILISLWIKRAPNDFLGN